MKCVICRSGNIEMQNVSEEIQWGNDIVLVPVRIPVCVNRAVNVIMTRKQCGILRN